MINICSEESVIKASFLRKLNCRKVFIHKRSIDLYVDMVCLVIESVVIPHFFEIKHVVNSSFP